MQRIAVVIIIAAILLAAAFNTYQYYENHSLQIENNSLNIMLNNDNASINNFQKRLDEQNQSIISLSSKVSSLQSRLLAQQIGFNAANQSFEQQIENLSKIINLKYYSLKFVFSGFEGSKSCMGSVFDNLTFSYPGYLLVNVTNAVINGTTQAGWVHLEIDGLGDLLSTQSSPSNVSAIFPVFPHRSFTVWICNDNSSRIALGVSETYIY